ncbi:hypothetical protein [uncultured Methylobacterium sp.]|uniref:hypothetical protein n=1 Tax=uncultured Methylobacterium sp. TaxID=157278 RepID=UPI0035C9A433
MSAPSHPDPISRGNGSRVAWSIAGLVAATVLLGALLPGRPMHAVSASPAEDPACAEWSDGCRVCRRLAEGPACSLPGIACTPGPLQCLHRAGG